MKYELQNIISGNERIGQSELIQTIACYLSRSKSEDSRTKKTAFSKREEEQYLTHYIENQALWFPEPDVDTYLSEGSEQRVYFDESTNTVLKINSSVFYLYWEDYLHSLLLHNFFFPHTPYTLLGFVKDDVFGICALVRQPYIDFDAPTNLEAVRLFLGANGFQNTRNNDYYNEELGIILEDLHEENVLSHEGLLFFIDSVFYLTPQFYA